MDRIQSCLSTFNTKGLNPKKCEKVESFAGLVFSSLGIAICMSGDRFGLSNRMTRWTLGGTTLSFGALLLTHGIYMIRPPFTSKEKMNINLSKLFEDSRYSKTFSLRYAHKTLPRYPIVINKDHKHPTRENMTDDVAIGSTDFGCKFIAIKVNCTLTEDNIKNSLSLRDREVFAKKFQAGQKIEQLIVLCQEEVNETAWKQLKRDSLIEPRFLFLDHRNFTHWQTGELIEEQKTNFQRLQNLLNLGIAEDNLGLVWKIG
jgi:hypothetical protein